jgi:tetratricopeptide (TPR) repeat protein
MRRALLLLLLLIAAPASAVAGIEDEANRQIELAEQDLASGNFERAAASASSALRLDPSRHDALVVRGLALQGLGRPEEAAALLRAYIDLRGTLPVDERVEPALAEMDRQLSGEPEPAPDPEEPPVVTGPVALIFGPDDDERAAERAYAAAQPFLGGEPATSILPLSSLLPGGDKLVVLAANHHLCADVQLHGTLVDQLEQAEAATTELEPEAAAEAVRAAEFHLTCGALEPPREALLGLLAASAMSRWFAGELEAASRLWGQLFALDPERLVDSTLPPAAQSLQLDAKVTATAAPIRGELRVLLPDGWSATLNGQPGDGSVLAGRQLVRLVGPDGQRSGAVVELEPGARATVATLGALTDAVQTTWPEGEQLRWLAGHLDDLVEREARAVLLVTLDDAGLPVVRHFDGQRFLVLTSTGGPGRVDGPPVASSSAVPRGASAALLGGGLAATAVGVIVAALAHGQGTELQGDMGTAAGFASNYASFQNAQTRERVGAGVAVGGGVIAAVGAITFVIPQPKLSREVAR